MDFQIDSGSVLESYNGLYCAFEREIYMKRYVENIYKAFDNLKVLDNISIDFVENGITCILGPSGAGKSTLLNIIASITKADSGNIEGFEGKSLSFVFQEDRLLEWRTVEENIAFVLKDKIPKNDREGHIKQYLKMVALYEYKDYYPNNLSGGMRQRVSIARAFAYPSEVLIMDEPFKSLDINTKQSLMKCFQELMNKHSRTVIFVTHDIGEAVVLGDEIVIMTDKPSKVNQVIKNTIPMQERWKENDKLDNLMGLIKKALLVEATIPRGV